MHKEEFQKAGRGSRSQDVHSEIPFDACSLSEVIVSHSCSYSIQGPKYSGDTSSLLGVLFRLNSKPLLFFKVIIFFKVVVIFLKVIISRR